MKTSNPTHVQRALSPILNQGAALLAACALMLFFTVQVRAQGIPPGCSGSAIGISLFTSAPDVHIGDTLFYSVSVFNGIAGNPTSCDASNIMASITTPDGVVHPITLRRTYLSHTESDFYSNVVSYVVRSQDIRADGTVRATAEDTAIIYQNDTPSTGGANQGVNTEVSQPCINILSECVGGIGEDGLITFTGTVTNCGNNTLVGVTVSNYVNGGAFQVAFVTNLLRGQIATFSGSYTSANACGTNTAVLVASGVDQFTTSPRTVVSSNTLNCGTTVTPGIRVTKACPAQPVGPGQLLVFSGTVSNFGNVTLTNVVVVNNQPAQNTVVFTRATLRPGETASFTGSYIAPTNCAISDTLAVWAMSVCGASVMDSVTTTCPSRTTPQILVTAVCPTGPIVPGGLITYGGTVRNTGDVTLTNVVVVSDRPSANTVVYSGTLAPGASAAFNGTYVVPRDGCSITTTFRGSGNSTCTGAQATNATSVTCTISSLPAIAVTLTCPPAPVAPGSVITYTGTVRNSGDVTLNNVIVVNNQPAANTVVLNVPLLAPGATANFTAIFTSPTNVCSVSSLITARGTADCTAIVVSNSAAATCPLLTSPGIEVVQNCPIVPASPGGLLTYTGSVSNSGNITLTNVVVTNDRSGAAPVFVAATLAPGVKLNFTGSYAVPSDSGCSINSTTTASAHDPCTGSNIIAVTSVTCPVVGNPRIVVTLACPTSPPPLGGTLNYSGTVSNSGDVTLSNVVVLNNRTGTNVVFGIAALAPRQAATFTGSYKVPADCCTVSSTVTARGNDCNDIVARDTASSTCTVMTSPRLFITKVCSSTAPEAGELMRYSGTISNAGDITLYDITIVNNLPTNGSPVVGGIILAPGESFDYEASYVLPVDSCGTDTITARGTSICGIPVVTNLTSTCPVTTRPRLVVTKNCPTLPTPRGGLFTFTGSVSNRGNVTLTNVYVVNSEPAENTHVIGPITLAPGASSNFTGSYIAPGCCCVIFDTLTARGQDQCTGSNVTATATAVCPMLTTPALSVAQDCPPTSQPIGSIWHFTGSVTNTGSVNLTNVVIVSSQPGNPVLLGPIELAPGESEGFNGAYTIVAGSNNTNAVIATGTDICQGRTVTTRAECSSSGSGNALAFGADGAPASTFSNGTFRASFLTQSGMSYTIVYKNNLNDSAWTDLQTIIGTGGYVTITDATAGRPMRFYRIKMP